jgi:hypothetical protein
MQMRAHNSAKQLGGESEKGPYFKLKELLISALVVAVVVPVLLHLLTAFS